MATAQISAKGWIVIPAEYRRKHGLHPGTKVQIVDYGGVLAVIPVLDDPVPGARGILKTRGRLTKALVDERRRERERETGQ